MIRRAIIALAVGALVLAIAAPVQAQLSPSFQLEFFNAAGTAPATSGFVCTTVSGGNVRQDTYQDQALTTVNQNPVRLNTAGRPVNGSTEVSIFLQPLVYRMTLYAAGTSNTCNGVPVGAIIKQVDGVNGSPNFLFTQGIITSDIQGLAGTVTWNSSGTVFTMTKFTVTDTASDASSKFVDYIVGSTSELSIRKDGRVNSNYGYAISGTDLLTTGGLGYSVIYSRLQQLGTVSIGTWQATKIGLPYGGTNADLSATGGTSQFLKQNTLGGPIVPTRPSCADLSDSQSGCSISFTAAGSSGFAIWNSSNALGSTATVVAASGGTGISTSASTGLPYVSAGTWSVNTTQLPQVAGIGIGVAAASGNIYSDAWQDYSATSTIGGWASFTTKQLYYKKIGKTIWVAYVLAGTSNATTISFTLPYAATGPTFEAAAVDAFDNNLATTTNGYSTLGSGSSTVSVFSSPGSGAWTNVNTKQVRGQFFYETP